MSEEVKNEENNSKQKWLWLLLLLLLIIFVVIAIVVFLKDDGTAEAADNISDEISQEQVKNDDEPKKETGISSNEKTQKLVVTAAETQLASAITTTETTSTPTEKTPIVVNVSDNSYFNEPVILKIDGENYSATITDSNGNVSKYEGNATLSEDGKYSLTIKESDGTEKTITFVIDKTNPAITGVEEGKTYNSEVTPIIEEPNIDKVTLTKDNNSVEYKSGDAITEDGTYTLTVEDKAGNTASVTFSIDTTAPELTVKKNITSMTKKSVTVTITANEEILLPNSDWKYVDDTKTIIKKVYRQNIEEDVIVKDLYNNEGTAHVKIANIDKVAPTASVTTSNNNGRWSTNKDVTATLIVNEPIKDIIGWTKVDDTTFTKVYSDNKKEKFEIEDLVGNKTKVEFEVKRIDKVPPTITVTDPNNYKMEVNTEYVEKGYSAYDVVDKDVTKLVTKKYQFQAKGTGTWPFVDELDTSKLGTYKIIYIAKDKAGNEAKGTRTVTIVDTTAPIITLKGEPVINFLERGVDTYTELGAISKDNYDEEKILENPSYINLYVLNDQGEYAFKGRVNSVDTNISGRYNLVYTATDSSGNDAIKVTRMVYVIDTIDPTASATTSNNGGSTNKDVTVTIAANESIKNIEGWTKVDDRTFTKVYSSNQKVTIEIEDLAGNKAKVRFEVKRIDKVPPVVTIIDPNKYQMEVNTQYVEKGYSAYDKVDKDVSKLVTKKYQFQAKGTGTWSFVNELDTGKLGTYKIIYIAKDKAGNEAKGTRVVEIVDTTAPTITLKGEPVINFLERGVDTYTELGAISNDNYHGMQNIEKPSYINHYIQNENGEYAFKGRVSSVDTTVSGRYNLVYTSVDSSGNEATKVTRMVYVIDTIAPIVTVESILEPVYDAEGNLIDYKGGQKLIANEDVEIVNEPALVPVNGSSREYEITYSLFNATHTGYHFINVIVRDRAGNETTADVEIFIPEYPTSNVSTTSTLISTPLRMTKSAPKAAAAPTNTTPVATEPEDNNDKPNGLVQNDLVITEDNKDDSNVITTDSTVDNKKDEQIIPTDKIVEDNKETVPAEPVIEDNKKDVQETAQTETTAKDETPVQPVEEPVEPATEPVVEEQISETIVTE